MKKILLLIIPLLFITGCGAKPINEDKADEKNYYMQDIFKFAFYTDRKTCVEYIIYKSYEKGGLTPRYSADGNLKLNEVCLKNKEK